MSSFSKSISIIAAAATIIATLSTVVEASPVQVIKQAPDLNEYCQRYYGVDARLVEFSALGWQCYKNAAKSWGISVNQACKNQYGLPRAAYANKADPYSWYCTTAKPEPARIDLNRYCKTHFGGSGRARLLGDTPLDWVCEYGSFGRSGISGNQACQEQHSLPKASYENINDPNSWYCHS